MCLFFGVEDYEDIIQELYVKLLTMPNIDRYERDGLPNMYIMYAMLRNHINDIRKSLRYKKTIYIDENNLIPKYIEHIDNDKVSFILDEIANVDTVFERKIIQAYVFEEHSIRSLSKSTTIPYATLQPIIADFKLKTINKYNKIKNGGKSFL